MLAEFLVVVYAMDLGVKDVGLLIIKGPVTITISPLFHLVPTAVIITLLFTWIYLTRKLSVRPTQSIGKIGSSSGKRIETKQSTSKTSQPAKSPVEKTKPSLSRVGGISPFWRRIHFARATIKSALTVFLVFLVLVLMMSLLTYPMSIYQAIAGSYQNHSPAYYFVVSIANSLRDFAEVVSPIDWIATAINNGLLAIAPGVRSIDLAFGSLIAPLANLDPAGKYLVFQNAAAWISVLLVLFYGQYGRRSYRYKKR